DSRIIIAGRVGGSESSLLEKEWFYIEEDSSYGYSGGDISFVRDLDRFNLKGRYFQFKIILETKDRLVNPHVSEFVISYASKKSVYFFTRKFKIEKQDSVSSIILTSTYFAPKDTEVKFGVVNDNSADWADYTLITLDELNVLPSNWGNNIKIGIKLSSYSADNYPTVQEFGFLIESETDNLLNEGL
ncbi:MAG: hypothetical protein NTW30_04925, partial [Candidatus Aenigmarchaeota archaeon]|nr:hypothetical protein [Candidatus Aenigmarchaeota archaeon]